MGAKSWVQVGWEGILQRTCPWSQEMAGWVGSEPLVTLTLSAPHPPSLGLVWKTYLSLPHSRFLPVPDPSLWSLGHFQLLEGTGLPPRLLWLPALPWVPVAGKSLWLAALLRCHSSRKSYPSLPAPSAPQHPLLDHHPVGAPETQLHSRELMLFCLVMCLLSSMCIPHPRPLLDHDDLENTEHCDS